jgi:prepilin-type N-terminal cleavage/methylation domain-containing protein
MYNIHSQKGFTLIETIVSVTILASAIAGPMTLAVQSLKATRDARLELEATYLISEALEVVHNIRDNNSGDDMTSQRSEWMTNLFTSCGTGDGCIVDPSAHGTYPLPVWKVGTQAPLLACPLGNCTGVSSLYYNPSTGLYRQSTISLPPPWKVSAFKRWVKITGVDASPPTRQARVTATVTYVGANRRLRTMSVSDDLYNWFPQLR